VGRAQSIGRAAKALPGKAWEGGIEYATEKINPASIGERVAGYGAIAMESVMKDILDEQVSKAEHYLSSHSRAMEHKLKQRIARGVARGQYSLRKLSKRPEVRDKIPNLPEFTEFTKPEGRLKLRQGMIGLDASVMAKINSTMRSLQAAGLKKDDLEEHFTNMHVLGVLEGIQGAKERAEEVLLRRGGGNQMGKEDLHQNWQPNNT
jgi:hypothetical protein